MRLSNPITVRQAYYDRGGLVVPKHATSTGAIDAATLTLTYTVPADKIALLKAWRSCWYGTSAISGSPARIITVSITPSGGSAVEIARTSQEMVSLYNDKLFNGQPDLWLAEGDVVTMANAHRNGTAGAYAFFLSMVVNEFSA